MKTTMISRELISRVRAALVLAALGLAAACGRSAEPAGPRPTDVPEPTAADADVPAAERLSAILPAAGPVTSVEFPAFTERSLDNGATVIVVENHEQPVVSINLRVRSGTATDPGS